MLEDYEHQNLEIIQETIKLGMYQKISEDDKFCMVEGFCRNQKDHKIYVLYKKFSDEFKETWSMRVDYFCNKYMPKENWYNEITQQLKPKYRLEIKNYLDIHKEKRKDLEQLLKNETTTITLHKDEPTLLIKVLTKDRYLELKEILNEYL
jgi:hypothetical protein